MPFSVAAQSRGSVFLVAVAVSVDDGRTTLTPKKSVRPVELPEYTGWICARQRNFQAVLALSILSHSGRLQPVIQPANRVICWRISAGYASQSGFRSAARSKTSRKTWWLADAVLYAAQVWRGSKGKAEGQTRTPCADHGPGLLYASSM